MRIIITGAAGKIGRQIVEELSGAHDLCLIDRRPVPGEKSIIANLARAPTNGGWKKLLTWKSSRWSRAFEKAEVVIHLAANPKVLAPWQDVLHDNIETTWHVLETAAMYKVPRVVFASSNWAAKALEQKLAPDCYRTDGPKIDSETAPFPLTVYGLSKGFGELAGMMFVNEQRLRSFVAVRIGNFNTVPSTDENVRSRWIGVEDVRALFRRCVESEFEGFHVVYGVSAQKTAPYDLSHTHRLLSWLPRQLPDDQRVRKREPA
jgi:uronate dehydrogenase